MSPNERTESLKKSLMRANVFDEADYYKSKKVQMGGEDRDRAKDLPDEDEDMEDEEYEEIPEED